MRRGSVDLAVAMALIGSLLAVGPTIAAPPPAPAVVSITVTAAGGTWPQCLQDVTVRYTPDRRVAGVLAYAWQDRCPYSYEFVTSTVATVAGRTTATLRVSADYSLFERWGWTATLLDRRGAWLSSTLPETTRSTFTPGRCPTSGVLATYP